MADPRADRLATRATPASHHDPATPTATPPATPPATPSDAGAGWAAAWAVADGVPGWLTAAQARRLYDEARRLRAGDVVLEIGSHRGRSTVAIAHAARSVGARVVAVDPFVAGGMFGGPATRTRFEESLRAGGVEDVVELRQTFSTRLRPGWETPLAMVFVDGKHDYWTTADDLRWSRFLPVGGRLLVHDSFSSIGVTLALLVHVLPSRRLRYLDRTGSLARFEVVDRVAAADRARVLGQVPWWLRNVAVKIVLRAWRLVGSPPPDPF